MNPNTGNIIPKGTEGEVWTRGYTTMLGYWGDEQKTKESIDPRGWMKTGDLGVMDEEGYLQISGRLKDLIIRGGENISPAEVEQHFMKHENVLDA